MPKQSLKQIAYNSIKEKILNCEYMPNSFLNEDLLCEEFGVSRTPIRDALSRLEQEYLITIVPKKGFFVAPLSANEINMVFEGRLLIEPYVLLNYCKDFPADKLERLYATLEETQKGIVSKRKDIYDLDNEFHETIISQCINRYLVQTYYNIHNQNCRLRIISGRANDKRLLDTVEEHFQILEGLSNKNYEKAAQAMTDHLTNSRASAFQAFLEGNSYL